LLGLVCAQFGFFYADSFAALAVAIIVLSVSFRLGKKAIDVLLDKAPEETIKLVEDVLNSYIEVKEYHGLKVRTAGADTFIKFNIHLEPESSLKSVHQICDEIEKNISSLIPRSEVYIHAEPQEEMPNE